jgi:3-oxoacyl-[acyl-carrier protein] reductase
MQLTGLKGKTALVTGSARGIGKAIAETLAKSGVNLVCCDINEDALRKTCSDIEKMGVTALAIKAELTSPSDRKNIIDQAVSKFKTIDFLINNAGMFLPTVAVDLEDDEMLKIMQVNFLSMFSLTRDVGRLMIKWGKGGKIVSMGSVSGQGGGSIHLAYAASKAAIEAMTRSLSVEWAPHNILVNTVAPGFVQTEMSRVSMEANPQLYQDSLAKIPLQHFADPSEVANMITFLCSKEADYITGHIYYVDGGTLIFHHPYAP